MPPRSEIDTGSTVKPLCRSSSGGTGRSVRTSTDGPAPETKVAVGGFAILEVASRADALEWAGRLAKAFRCAQEVLEIFYDPAS